MMENKLKQAIINSGYKNTFLAQQLGVHSTELSQWIANRRRPRNEQIRNLAKILGCKIKEIYPDYKLQ